ncbi:MAG: sensor histidine kinase [Acidimicrobiales bacterium]
MTVVRWATVALGLALAALEQSPRRPIVAGLVLVVYAGARTVWPLRYRVDQLGSMVAVVIEVLLTLGVVVATGYWRSPYVFSVTAALMAAGFARGFGFAIRTAVATSLAVAIPLHLQQPTARIAESFQWAGELVLIALVAGYARRLFGEAQERIRTSQQANDLLLQLHSVAQDLPTSLDLSDTASGLAAQLRVLVPDADAIAILLLDESSDRWTVTHLDGARLPPSMASAALPPLLTEAVTRRQPTWSGGPGLTPGSAESLFLPLTVGVRAVGAAVVETTKPATLPPVEDMPLTSILGSAALALDNARWFSKLRTVGADEERQRIARDLHDRLGQSLTYLSFELDRLTKSAGETPVATELARLRDDARRLVAEVRDTLYDLRTEVSDERDLSSTLRDFLARVENRTSITFTLNDDSTDRLPLRQEQEVWRIAQEAVTNAIRHAGATRVGVVWSCQSDFAVLEVTDNGIGLPTDQTTTESFGLTGMRERAEAIGAALDISSIDGQGTVISCRLKRR